jgi:hypothetical protein
MTKYSWQAPYLAAVLESDWPKVEERIQAAETEIHKRRLLSQDQGGAEEREALAKAVSALNVLRLDAVWSEKNRIGKGLSEESNIEKIGLRDALKTIPPLGTIARSEIRTRIDYKPDFSAAINLRSRCGSVRFCPAPSSHRTPGAAPQVGQRMASTCFGVMSFNLGAFPLCQNSNRVSRVSLRKAAPAACS